MLFGLFYSHSFFIWGYSLPRDLLVLYGGKKVVFPPGETRARGKVPGRPPDTGPHRGARHPETRTGLVVAAALTRNENYSVSGTFYGLPQPKRHWSELSHHG